MLGRAGIAEAAAVCVVQKGKTRDMKQQTGLTSLISFIGQGEE